jgi:hypothetical protein
MFAYSKTRHLLTARLATAADTFSRQGVAESDQKLYDPSHVPLAGVSSLEDSATDDLAREATTMLMQMLQASPSIDSFTDPLLLFALLLAVIALSVAAYAFLAASSAPSRPAPPAAQPEPFIPPAVAASALPDVRERSADSVSPQRTASDAPPVSATRTPRDRRASSPTVA